MIMAQCPEVVCVCSPFPHNTGVQPITLALECHDVSKQLQPFRYLAIQRLRQHSQVPGASVPPCAVQRKRPHSTCSYHCAHALQNPPPTPPSSTFSSQLRLMALVAMKAGISNLREISEESPPAIKPLRHPAPPRVSARASRGSRRLASFAPSRAPTTTRSGRISRSRRGTT